MNARTISYDDVRRDVAGVVNDVYSGGTVLLQEADKTVAAIISYEDYLALQEELEELRDIRLAEAALEEYRRDPSSAIPWEEAREILRTDGLIDGE
jgi:prevent-host-death family protein